MDGVSLGSPLLRRYAAFSGLLDRLRGLTPADSPTGRDVAALADHFAGPVVAVVAGDPAADVRSLADALFAAAAASPPEPPEPSVRPGVRLLGARTRDVWPQATLPVRREAGRPGLPEVLAAADLADVPAGPTGLDALGRELRCQADLLLFVFSAINPYTRSVWERFDALAPAFGQDVTILLDRTELAAPGQLAVNVDRLRAMLRERGLAAPRLFATTGGNGPDGGLEAVRRQLLTLGRPEAQLAAKLASARRAALGVLGVAAKELDARQRALDADADGAKATAGRLGGFLEAGTRQAGRLADEADQAYGKQAAAFVDALRQELELAGLVGKGLAGGLGRGEATGLTGRLRAHGEAFARELGDELALLAEDWAGRVVADVEARFGLLRDALDVSRLPGPWPLSDALGVRRGEILSALAGLLDAFARERTAALAGEFAAVSGLGHKTLAGGALAVAGTVFAVAIKGAIFDVTGGVLTSIGAAVAGGALLWQRGRFLDDVAAALEIGRQQLRDAMQKQASGQLLAFYANFSEHLAHFEENIRLRNTALRLDRQKHAALDASLRNDAYV